MIPKIISTGGGGKRAAGGAVFGRVGDYIENKPEQERGQTLMADCVLDPRSAAMEMEAVALSCPACEEPAMHLVLSWQNGEHPTEQQQREAVEVVLKNLQRDGRDMSDHQWVAVLHRDTDNDHLHILVNRIHPETGRAVAPEWSDRSLHKAAREIEAAQGWREDAGLMKWDAQLGHAVPTPNHERVQQQAIPAPAAAMEAHSYSESLYGYIKSQGVEKELQQVLARDGATWADVQYSLGVHGLELRQAPRGGYTITDGKEPVKASDAAKSIFSGKENRARLEGLGDWVNGDRSIATTTYSPHREPQHEERAQHREEQKQPEQKQEQKAAPYRRDDPEATQRRAEKAEERAQARAALKERYQTARAEWKRTNPLPSRAADYKAINAELKAERQAIRKRTAPKSNARIAAESVAAFKKMEKEDRVKAEVAAQRQANQPPGYKEWVTDKANAGDKAAQVQIKGWEYQAKRTPDDLRAALERNEQRQPARNEGLLAGVEWRRRWFIGGVEYKIDSKAAVIDKGAHLKLVGGERRADDRSIALMLGLQAAKTGGNVGVTGSREFRERCAWVAAEKGLSVKFADPKLQAHYDAQKAQIKQFNQLRAEERKQPQKQPEAGRSWQSISAQQQREQKARGLGKGLGLGG